MGDGDLGVVAGPEPRGEQLIVPAAQEELLTNKDYFWDWEE